MAKKKKAKPAGPTGPGVIGKWVIAVSPMRSVAMEEGWSGAERTPMIVLNDGTRLYPSQDYEGNGPGALFGEAPPGMFAPGEGGFYVFPGQTPSLIARRIIKVRPMTPQEMERQAWDEWSRPFVLEFDDGATVFPSRDEEGNGPGAIFGQTPKGERFFVVAEGPKEWSPRR